MKIRSKLHEVIEQKGFQKKFIATKIGVTPTQIGNWNNDEVTKLIKAVPSVLNAMALAKILECKVEDLFELVEDD